MSMSFPGEEGREEQAALTETQGYEKAQWGTLTSSARLELRVLERKKGKWDWSNKLILDSRVSCAVVQNFTLILWEMEIDRGL